MAVVKTATTYVMDGNDLLYLIGTATGDTWDYTVDNVESVVFDATVGESGGSVTVEVNRTP